MNINSFINFPQNGLAPPSTGPPTHPTNNNEVSVLLHQIDSMLESDQWPERNKGIRNARLIHKIYFSSKFIERINSIARIAISDPLGTIQDNALYLIKHLLSVLPGADIALLDAAATYLIDDSPERRVCAINLIKEIGIASPTQSERSLYYAMHMVRDFNSAVKYFSRKAVDEICSVRIPSTPDAPIVRLPFYRPAPKCSG